MDPSVSRVLCQKKGQFCTGNFWFISIRKNFGADTRDNIAMKYCTRAWILLNYLQPRLEPSTSWLIGRCCESKAPLVLFEREREKKSIDFFSLLWQLWPLLWISRPVCVTNNENIGMINFFYHFCYYLVFLMMKISIHLPGRNLLYERLILFLFLPIGCLTSHVVWETRAPKMYESLFDFSFIFFQDKIPNGDSMCQITVSSWIFKGKKFSSGMVGDTKIRNFVWTKNISSNSLVIGKFYQYFNLHLLLIF